MSLKISIEGTEYTWNSALDALRAGRGWLYALPHIAAQPSIKYVEELGVVFVSDQWIYAIDPTNLEHFVAGREFDELAQKAAKQRLINATNRRIEQARERRYGPKK